MRDKKWYNFIKNRQPTNHQPPINHHQPNQSKPMIRSVWASVNCVISPISHINLFLKWWLLSNEIDEMEDEMINYLYFMLSHLSTISYHLTNHLPSLISHQPSHQPSLFSPHQSHSSIIQFLESQRSIKEEEGWLNKILVLIWDDGRWDGGRWDERWNMRWEMV